jgi:DNA-binding NtrC family response regulator
VSSHREDQDALRQIFRDTNWQLREALGYRDTLAILCADRMPVIICECCMPDGTWKDIMGQIVILPNAPRLIVAARERDDRLNAEVFNWGGYDLLVRPFDQTEVLRAVSRAWQNWQDEWCRTNRRWKTSGVGA